MKSTNAYLVLPNADQRYLSRDGRVMLEGFKLGFNLSEEDWDTFRNYIFPQMKDCDLADALLAVLTYGLHRLYEDVTGRRFVLDIDRDKN